ncbi:MULTISPECIES: sugar transferase [unclassified Francisella]|uniref:sugar transferase n=1 Tax=unclassified Francisella TaxID=2610885 RepID=UPI002E2FA88B|nr:MULTISPECIES: sugar transferase [unclassified Francisella]MED7818626.1 sugar transferase [Francisella sp. 19S2-4]MED7829462.1 sugar transferase [Francisella sp. 19S2-10]
MSLLKCNKPLIYLKIIEIIISVIIVLLSYSIPLHLLKYNTSNFSSFNFLATFIVITSLFVFLVSEYTNGEKTSKSRNVLKVLLCCLSITIIITSLAFFLRGFSFPRSLIILGFLIQFIVLSLLRVFFRSLMRKTIRNKILILGLEDENKWIFEKAKGSKLPNELITGYLSLDNEGFDLSEIISKHTKVFISDKALKKMSDNDLVVLSKYGMEIVLIPRKYEISIWGAILVPLGDSMAMSVKNFGLSFEAQAIKRIFDIVCSSILIVLSLPIMLITALAIFLEDRKSPFFVQERVTKNNVKFKLIKFRSMRPGAEAQTGAVWSFNSDDRVTKIGKIIRPIWIDELPQFFNVLKGDMSIVGPRPERQELIDEFTKSIPEFIYRTKIKAGITGYAQVLTNYETLPENKLKLDLIYIRRWSFIFDLLIIIETVRVICKKIINLFLPKNKVKNIQVKETKNKNYIEYIYE